MGVMISLCYPAQINQKNYISFFAPNEFQNTYLNVDKGPKPSEVIVYVGDSVEATGNIFD